MNDKNYRDVLKNGKVLQRKTPCRSCGSRDGVCIDTLCEECFYDYDVASTNSLQGFTRHAMLVAAIDEQWGIATHDSERRSTPPIVH